MYFLRNLCYNKFEKNFSCLGVSKIKRTKILFIALAIVGGAIIITLSFILPSNPYEIMPSVTMMLGDIPLWLMYSIEFAFLYLLILFAIYDKLIPSGEEKDI